MMIGGKRNSCLAVFTWIVVTLVFTVVLSLTFRATLPILFDGNQSSNMFHETSGFNDGDNVPTPESTVPPVLIESTTGNSLKTGFVFTLAIEPHLKTSGTSIIDEKVATVGIPTLGSHGSILTTQMTTLTIEPETSVSEVDFKSVSPRTGEDLLVNETMFYDLDLNLSEDKSAFDISMFKDADLPIRNTKTAVAVSTEPQLDDQDKNNIVYSADGSTLVIPIIEVFLLNNTPGATVPVKQTGPKTAITKADLLFGLELEADEIIPEINSTLDERYKDMANNLVVKETIHVNTEIANTALLPVRKVTSVVKRPAPFRNFMFSKNKDPARPVVTAEKVAAQHSYDFFAENSTYVKSVEICRQIGQGSRLLSIESVQEERIVDAYVKSHQNEIFGHAEYERYIWTGGYFDLESYQPYELRWVDHPASLEPSSYRNFCPESRDVQSVIDQALLSVKAQTSGLSNLNPCDRRWAQVILDFTGHRIDRSCWQILARDILSADGSKLPFICKR